MIEIRPNSHSRVLGIRATGKLTDQDYQEVLIPALEGIIQGQGRAGFLCHMDENFDGLAMGAMRDDARFFLKHKNDFERWPWWAGVSFKVEAPLIKFPFRESRFTIHVCL